jgi:hypothetical protein
MFTLFIARTLQTLYQATFISRMIIKSETQLIYDLDQFPIDLIYALYNFALLKSMNNFALHVQSRESCVVRRTMKINQMSTCQLS